MNKFARFALLTVLFTCIITRPSPPIASARQDLQSPELAQMAADGVTIETLAGMTAPLPADDEITPLLTRLVNTGSGEPEPAIVVGPEVWYVEEGSLTLFDPQAGQTNYQAGEQIALDRPDIYQYRISGEGCASVLRFQVQVGAGMEISSGETGPALGPNRGQACAAFGDLNASWMSQSAPASPVMLSVSRVTLAKFAFAPETTLTGPAILVAEKGGLDVTLANTYQARFTAGGSVLAPAGSPFTVTPVGEEGATLLLAAVLSAGAAPPVAISHDYTSPTFGYTLDWPDAWSVLDESSAGGVDRLQLTNSVSTIFVQGFETELPDAFACIDSALAGYTVEAGYGTLAVLESITGDGVKAKAVYSYTWTQGEQSEAYASWLSCEFLAGGGAAVFVSHTAPLTAYGAEAEIAAEVIDTLVLPAR